MPARAAGNEHPVRGPLRLGGWSIVWLALVLVALASCERKPSKSDYVSARVSELCADEETVEGLQACRLAVIRQFKDTPLEELQRLYPPPEPRPRPSCSLW